MTASPFVEIGRFEISRDQMVRWRRGELRREWAARFPQLFDSDDRRLARTQGPDGYHFIEWLGAIVLYHLTGYRSLISKYEFPKHARKQEIVHRLLPEPLLKVIRHHPQYGLTQCPDLLAHAPDLSDWSFCEVKGPRDRLGARQQPFFEELARISGKPVRLLYFKWCPSLAAKGISAR
jgi:hypothetical protein